MGSGGVGWGRVGAGRAGRVGWGCLGGGVRSREWRFPDHANEVAPFTAPRRRKRAFMGVASQLLGLASMGLWGPWGHGGRSMGVAEPQADGGCSISPPLAGAILEGNG
jgi:hypothetical protein